MVESEQNGNDEIPDQVNCTHPEHVGDSKDEQCGCNVKLLCLPNKYFKLTCGCLQQFATPGWALFLLCIAQTIQQTVMSGLLSVCISTLEKRFELRSAESGIIASSLDISSVCTLIVISFMGENVHKPKWIGWGVFISVIGGLLFTTPHFLAPTYRPIYTEGEISNYCGNVTESSCTFSSLRNYRYIFIVAMAIFGIGANPLYTHAITYIDENVRKEKSSLFNGIYYAMSGLGPAFGYICGGALLEIYTNISVE